MTVDLDELLKLAQRAEINGYAPYSKQPKGAALLTAGGALYAAANVENAAWSPTVCAEAGALSAAVADGHRKFAALALAPYRFPCGICLQAFREFGLDLEISTVDAAGKVTSRTLEQLLPLSFGPDSLGT